MELSDFGFFVRKKRLENRKTLTAQAKAIGVSSAYLSSIETGKRPVTKSIIEQTIIFFQLNEEDKREIWSTFSENKKSIKIEIGNFDDLVKEADTRRLVAAFSRKLSDLTDEQRSQMMKILEEL